MVKLQYEIPCFEYDFNERLLSVAALSRGKFASMRCPSPGVPEMITVIIKKGLMEGRLHRLQPRLPCYQRL